jgi:hypothetical protein
MKYISIILSKLNLKNTEYILKKGYGIWELGDCCKSSREGKLIG